MKITFIGAGSTVFAKNVLGDCLLAENLPCFEIALLDIDEEHKTLTYYKLYSKVSSLRYLSYKYFRATIFDCMNLAGKL